MQKKESAFLLWLLAVSLLLRLYRIHSQSLWVDELLTLNVSVPRPGLNIWDYLKYNIHGPLHSFVVYLFHFVSVHDGWLRVPSVAAGVAGVFYFYRWVGVWLGERVARRAAVLLAVHPLHVYYSQELRNYSLLFFFGMFASYFLHGLLKKETPRRFLAYVLGIAASALCNFSSAFLYVVHSILYLARRAPGRRFARWAVVSMLVAGVISPWVYRIYKVVDLPSLVTPVLPGDLEDSERLRGDTTVTLAAIPYALYTFSVGFSMGPSTRELHGDPSLRSVLGSHTGAILWVTLVFGAAGLLGAVGAVRRGDPWPQVALYLWLPIALVILLCWQNAKAFNVRYVLLSFPAYLCLIAMGIEWLPGRWSRALWVLVLATLLYSLGNYYFNGSYAREDVRGAARYVKANAAPGDCVLAPTVMHVFTRYYGEEGVYSVRAPAGKPVRRVDEELAALLANCETLWYVRAREWEDDPHGYVLNSLDRRLLRLQTVNYDGVTVTAYRMPDSQ
ncbi:MAG: glycosyltransferase family 39 protein [Candidatus Krumholzibacteriia bacterium]